jgi:uroporphyrinogen-III synthase
MSAAVRAAALVLITRPEPEANELAERLAARGYATLIEPLLEIRLLMDGRPLDFAGVQAILISSANGVRALDARLAASDKARALPLFAVGPASAEAATAAGFLGVEAANGDVGALAALVGRRCTPSQGRLVHVAGSVVAGDLAGRLAAQGFTVDRVTLYEAVPARTLSPSATRALKAGTIDQMLFFSPRTAETFVRLIEEAGLGAALGRATALCLSDAVATVAGRLSWGAIRIAARPEEEALLETLARPDAAR